MNAKTLSLSPPPGARADWTIDQGWSSYTQAEHDVYQRFRELSRGRTTILISHRFSIVRMADRILVLDRGHVVEEGPHDALVRAEGLYADLYEKQASHYR